MPEPYSFFTLFDANYLPRATALIGSLHRQVGEFRLFALCMDQAAFDWMSSAGDRRVVPISLSEFEAAEPDVLQVKHERSRVEYYFLCSSGLAHHLFERFDEPSMLTLVDADTYFFSDPRPVFEELEGHSIGITEHRFHKRRELRQRYGRFNVGWISFRRDGNGRACARWWRDRCVEWCFDRAEDGKFADQGYLDQWPERFEGVHVIQHPGVNLGPWNIGGHRLSLGADRVPTVDGHPLIHYHFAEVKQLLPWLYSTNLAQYQTRPSRIARRHVYGPYLRELRRRAAGSDATRRIRHPEMRFGDLTRWMRRASFLALGMIYNQYVVVRNLDGRFP